MVESSQGFDSESENANRITESNPYPSEKEKNNGLGRALIGGLVGGALGSLAAVLAGRKLVQSYNHNAKVEENGAKTVDTVDAVDAVTGVNHAASEGTTAVQNKLESADNSVPNATDTSECIPSREYQQRFNAPKNTSPQVIYISPSSTRTKVNSSDETRLREEINRQKS